jgi:hypothetical protein
MLRILIFSHRKSKVVLPVVKGLLDGWGTPNKGYMLCTGAEDS